MTEKNMEMGFSPFPSPCSETARAQLWSAAASAYQRSCRFRSRQQSRRACRDQQRRSEAQRCSAIPGR
jgi:hypothetical protein